MTSVDKLSHVYEFLNTPFDGSLEADLLHIFYCQCVKLWS
jgi:hypothetical protein